MSFIFSTREELAKMALILSRYMRLPVSSKVIPGAFLEAVLAHVRDATLLNTYDYVDVYRSADRVGWSIKSTKWDTPVTWKRAKLSKQVSLIEQSRSSEEGRQVLGNSIIEFCNAHAFQSMERYGLDEIGYSRLIVHEDREVTYFERKLCDRDQPEIFRPEDFEWRWSTPKATEKKEQLPALHGFDRASGRKWWAWHGLGENQLHFSGDRTWWPTEDDPHAVRFKLPGEDEKISFDRLTELLESL